MLGGGLNSKVQRLLFAAVLLLLLSSSSSSVLSSGADFVGEQVYARVVGGRRVLVFSTAMFTASELTVIPVLAYIDAASSRARRLAFTRRFLEFAAVSGLAPVAVDYTLLPEIAALLDEHEAPSNSDNNDDDDDNDEFVELEGFSSSHEAHLATITVRLLAPESLVTTSPVELAVDACQIGRLNYRDSTASPDEAGDPFFACVRALVPFTFTEAGLVASSSRRSMTARLDAHVAHMELRRLRAYKAPPWWNFEEESEAEVTRQVVALLSGRSPIASAVINNDDPVSSMDPYYEAVGETPPPRDVLEIVSNVLKRKKNATTSRRRQQQVPSYSSSRGKRCAVVGSSGLLLGSGMGARVDAHGFVLRFNGAPTSGYESDVGNRTDLRVVNSAAPAYLLRAADEPLLVVAKDLLDLLLLDGLSNNNVHLMRPSSRAQDADAWLNANSRWPWREAYPGYSASTGMHGLFWALRHCQTVSLFGFGIVPDAPVYYFDKNHDLINRALLAEEEHSDGGGGLSEFITKRVYFPRFADPDDIYMRALMEIMHQKRDVEHNWRYEQQLIEDLHNAGIIRNAHSAIEKHEFVDLLALLQQQNNGTFVVETMHQANGRGFVRFLREPPPSQLASSGGAPRDCSLPLACSDS